MTAKPERRMVADERTRATRSATKTRTIEGYAAIFDQETTIGGVYRERISPSAFESRNDGPVVATFNHDLNWVIGSTRSGTCAIDVTPQGLKYSVSVPEGPIGDHGLAVCERGDLGGSSFAFLPHDGGDRWVDPATDGDLPLRVLESVELLDVSVVVNPAYPDTSATVTEARATVAAYRQTKDQAAAQDAVEDSKNGAEQDADPVSDPGGDSRTDIRRRRQRLHEHFLTGEGGA